MSFAAHHAAATRHIPYVRDLNFDGKFPDDADNVMEGKWRSVDTLPAVCFRPGLVKMLLTAGTHVVSSIAPIVLEEAPSCGSL